ncbi:hypothetical protein [Oceanispirochaeta crateris]|nr:hypothetical protein [Oceanispirochaeta crateris]
MHIKYMLHALELAVKRVGAVLLKKHKIIGMGFRKKPRLLSWALFCD